MTSPCLPTTESLNPLCCYVCGARQAQRQATKWQAVNRRWSTSNAGTYQKFAHCTITSGWFGRIGDLNMHGTEHSNICFHGPPSLQCHTNRHLHRTRPALIHALRQRVQLEPVHWEGHAEPIGFRVLCMEDAVRIDLKSEITLKMSSVRCQCRALMEAHPVLQNECGHVICRS